MSSDVETQGIRAPAGTPVKANVIPLSRRIDAQGLNAIARRAQQAWARRPIADRLAVIATLRTTLADRAPDIAAAIGKRPAADTLTGEILPLLEACRYLERNAARVLRPDKRRGGVGLWLHGTELGVRREPYGVVLIIGASNYGLMLAGIQALQAIVAGNAVIIKPAAGEGEALRRFAGLLEQSGLPHGVISVVDESVESVYELLDGIVDKIIFTGSSAAGQAVIERAARLLIPVTAELSGWDAALILADADLDLAADAIAFALAFNAGRTCLAPRRLLVSSACHDAFVARLVAALNRMPRIEHDPATAARMHVHVTDALKQGAQLAAGTLSTDHATGPMLLTGVTPAMSVFTSEIFGSIALVTVVDNDRDAVTLANQTPYGLGASVFGARDRAKRLAAALDAGVVLINDAFVPAAHPALPIAPRGASGFGVTRGPEGLLAMTRPKAVVAGPRRPLHLAGPRLPVAGIQAYIETAYGRGGWARARAALTCLRELMGTRAEALSGAHAGPGEPSGIETSRENDS